MEKELLVFGTGSWSGQKRMRADGNDEGVVIDEKPSWELSLGAIYGGATSPSTPALPVPHNSTVAAAVNLVAQAPVSAAGAALFAAGAQIASSLLDGGNGASTSARASLALPVPVSHHSAVAAAVNLVAQAPVPGAGAALFAAGAEIASSLLDGGNGASTSVLASLRSMTSSRAQVAPAAALNLVAHVPVPAAGAAFIATGTSPAPPPRASPAARPAQRQVRRRIASGSPSKPATVAIGDPPVRPANGTAPLLAIPPFPWATNRVAIHHPISHLSALGITAIHGEVHCSRCDARKTIYYDIASKFQEVRAFVALNVHDMDDRAPQAWLHPTSQLRDCDACGQKSSVRPVIPAEKERINWVFLLVGQTLGLCTLEQLKFFCAHTRQHRTSAKDRVLYSTYMELCNQLCLDRLFKLTAERKSRRQQYS